MKITKNAYYDKRGESYERFDQEAVLRYERAIEWMNLVDNPCVIEIGCKYGDLYKLLSNTDKDFEYRAVDIDRRTLRNIPEYSKSRFICGDVNKGFPFPDGSADYIVCMEVMEHLENATFFLEEAKRVLKDKGRLIFSVPNPYCWMELFNNMRKYGDTEGHIASYTWQNIDALLKFSGLSLIRHAGTFTRIPFAKKLFGRHIIIETDIMFLTRNYMFLVQGK